MIKLGDMIQSARYYNTYKVIGIAYNDLNVITFVLLLGYDCGWVLDQERHDAYKNAFGSFPTKIENLEQYYGRKCYWELHSNVLCKMNLYHENNECYSQYMKVHTNIGDKVYCSHCGEDHIIVEKSYDEEDIYVE